LADRVRINERKTDFRPQKNLPIPDFATADGQKYRGFKKYQGGVISPGGGKKLKSKKSL
jgi:hypothetical protein